MQTIWQYQGTAKWAIYKSPLHLDKSEFSMQTTPNEEVHWRDGIRAADTLPLSFTLPRAHFMFIKHIRLTGSLISIFSVMHARIWALCSYCSHVASATILSWITAAPYPSSCLFTPHPPVCSPHTLLWPLLNTKSWHFLPKTLQWPPVPFKERLNPIQGAQGPAILMPHYLADPSPASPSPHSLELPQSFPWSFLGTRAPDLAALSTSSLFVPSPPEALCRWSTCQQAYSRPSFLRLHPMLPIPQLYSALFPLSPSEITLI